MLAPMGGAAFAKAVEDFRVELTELRSTAGELASEVQALYGAAEELAGTPQFGDEKIAGVLAIGPYHATILPQWQKFVVDLHGGIATGEAALRDVADRYETTDTSNGERMNRIGTDTMEEHGVGDGER